MRATIKLLLNKKVKKNYLNIDYFVTLINRVYLNKIFSNLLVKNIASSIIIRDLEFNRYKTSKYIIISLYFSNKNAIIIISLREIYIINKLKINILVSINIIISKKIDIFISN